ncbi:MAG TPA: hypothetical protein VEA58_01260 [Anaerovoracaceae bacterium]|nr:hypothetical protein [Anaerovoracaceae bacterium]
MAKSQLSATGRVDAAVFFVIETGDRNITVAQIADIDQFLVDQEAKERLHQYLNVIWVRMKAKESNFNRLLCVCAVADSWYAHATKKDVNAPGYSVSKDINRKECIALCCNFPDKTEMYQVLYERAEGEGIVYGDEAGPDEVAEGIMSRLYPDSAR